MKIIVHMGNYKTGSTALQSYLFQNRHSLAEHGVYYGDTEEPPLCSHASLAYALLRTALEQLNQCELWTSHPLSQYITETPETMWERICHEATAASCHTIVLSHESLFCETMRTFCGLHHPPENSLARDVLCTLHRLLHQLLSQSGSCVDAVIYLRRQDDYLESQYNQYIKEPWFEDPLPPLPDFQQFLSLNPVTLDYLIPLQILLQCYGREHLFVRNYPSGQDICDSFCRDILHLDNTVTENWKRPDTAMENRSLSHDILSFKRHYFSGDSARNTAIQTLLSSYSSTHPDSCRYTLFTPELHAASVAGYQEKNRQINQDFIRNPSDYLPDLTYACDRIHYPGLSPDKLLAITDYLSSI